MESPEYHLPHLEGTWLVHFRESLAKMKASLRIADLAPIPPQRQYDPYLMDIALAHPPFNDRDIRFINYCRLYFGALTL